MPREIGPWSRTFGALSTQITGMIDNRGTALSAPRIWSPASSSVTLGYGVKSTRTGYYSPSRPFITPRPASLVKTQHFMSENLNATWLWPSQNLAIFSQNCGVNHDWVIFQALQNALVIDNSARSKFLKKARAGLDILPIIGEARETARGIASDATTLSKGIQKHYSVLPNKREWRRLVTTGGVLKWASDRWLSLVYGYKPLIGDITKGLVALEDLSLLNRPRAVGNAEFDRQYTLVRTRHQTNSVVQNASGSANIVTSLAQVRETYTSALGASFNPSAGGTIRRQLGVNWQDVVPTLYELFPYSFVVDYFSNLGEVIQSHSFDLTTWSNAWFMRHQVVSAKITSKPQPPNANYSSLVSGNPGHGELTSVIFNRGPAAHSDFLVKFELKQPTLAQSANLIALAASRLTSIPRIFVRLG